VSAVLLVQADPSLHEQWTEALSRSGHEVLAVHDVGEGIARAREGGIDVVVLDAPMAAGDDAMVRELVAALARLPHPPPLLVDS
jgi:DNA-binding response OmpR family regulator